MGSEVRGGAAFSAALDAYIRAARTVTGPAAKAAGDHVTREIVSNLTRRSHPPGTVTPSVPGQPPASISGHLAATVRASPVIRTGDRFRVRIRAGAVYARIQEKGGLAGRRRRTRLPPRPYMAPAILAAAPAVRRIFREYWSTLGRHL